MAHDATSGLIKWLGREQWALAFEDTYLRHVEIVCRNMEVDVEDIDSILDDQLRNMLWGCVFEDLISARGEEPNFAEDYLKRRGWKESAGTRAYITAVRHSVMSLYEVSDVIAGESFLARDLIRGGEPVRVIERSATKSLKQWDKLGAKIVTVLGKTQLAGGVLIFEASAAKQLLKGIELTRKQALADVRISGVSGDRAAFSRDEVLSSAAFMFTGFWLEHTLDILLNARLPRMQNYDGDPIEFITAHFPLPAEPDLNAIRAAISALPGLSGEGGDFWNWIRPESERPVAGKKTEQKDGTFTAFMEDGSTVLGNIEITARAVVLSVNSEARARRGQAMLEAALQQLVRPPLTERQTVEQVMQAQRERPRPPAEPDIPLEDQQKLVRDYQDRHYRKTLDEKLPVTGGKSPREAVKTKKGRALVIEWLKHLENQSGRMDQSGLIDGYDFAWMWQELGVEGERK